MKKKAILPIKVYFGLIKIGTKRKKSDNEMFLEALCMYVKIYNSKSDEERLALCKEIMEGG